jgi:hypothetical protein
MPRHAAAAMPAAPCAAASRRAAGAPPAPAPCEAPATPAPHASRPPASVRSHAPAHWGCRTAADAAEPPQGAPVLTKAGYYLEPSLAVLRRLSDAQLAAVPGFVVGRHGFGRIEWDGASRRALARLQRAAARSLARRVFQAQGRCAASSRPLPCAEPLAAPSQARWTCGA